MQCQARTGQTVGGFNRPLLGSLIVLSLLAPAYAAHAAPNRTLPPASRVLLIARPSSPQPVGTSIRWIALASDTVPLVYRFSVAPTASGPFTVVRDFSTNATVVWTPLQEGAYTMQVTIKEGYGGTATVSKTALFLVTSRVSRGAAVVSHLTNPLVALYSAPACASGQMLVAFRAVGSRSWTDTNAQVCQSGLSRNFLVAGMLARTTYEMVHVLISGDTAITSTPLSFTTGAPPRSLVFPTVSVPQPPGAQSDIGSNVVFHDLEQPSTGEVNPLATDLQGRLLWYIYQSDLPASYALRIQQVGGQLGDEVITTGADGSAGVTPNVLRIIDLAGNPVQETNIQALNQELEARGQQAIYGFSHDALVLPNGDLATISYIQRTITSTAVMGDMVIVLDKNLQVVWTWNAFDHLNPYRGPTLGDTCAESYPLCPVPGGPNTIDWTHMNAIDYTPADGNLLLSLRAQDWVIKVAYANGSGDGHVLWRLGAQGDFSLVPLNPHDAYPWFSHQHDANYVDPTTLTLFDNGNTRCASAPPPCASRGQVYIVNEQSKVVTQTVNVDLGSYSEAFGTAQRLSNGNYDFTLGIQFLPPPLHAQEIETQSNGNQVFVQQISALEYRAWRLPSLYSPTNLPCPSCQPAG